jgi:hypothetical protein
LKCKACGQRIKLPAAPISPQKPVPVPVDLSPPVKRHG